MRLLLMMYGIGIVYIFFGVLLIVYMVLSIRSEMILADLEYKLAKAMITRRRHK